MTALIAIVVWAIGLVFIWFLNRSVNRELKRRRDAGSRSIWTRRIGYASNDYSRRNMIQKAIQQGIAFVALALIGSTWGISGGARLPGGWLIWVSATASVYVVYLALVRPWSVSYRQKMIDANAPTKLYTVEPAQAEDAPDGGLLTEVAQMLNPFVAHLRHEGGQVVVDLVDIDGTMIWPSYVTGPNDTLASVAAEQRYLTEQVGSGAVPGATYSDMAKERVRRWQAATAVE